MKGLKALLFHTVVKGEPMEGLREGADVVTVMIQRGLVYARKTHHIGKYVHTHVLTNMVFNTVVLLLWTKSVMLKMCHS